MSPLAIGTFAKHHVKVISYPPHVTHILQPVDVAFARAFKNFLRREYARLIKTGAIESEVRMSFRKESERKRMVMNIALLNAHSAARTRPIMQSEFSRMSMSL
jgi:hypothetical protein